MSVNSNPYVIDAHDLLGCPFQDTEGEQKIGETDVLDIETHRKVKLSIYSKPIKSIEEGTDYVLNAYIDFERQPLKIGYLSFYLKNESFDRGNLSIIKKSLAKQGLDTNVIKSMLKVEHLFTKAITDRYKGVGTALMQCAIELSQKYQLKGRVGFIAGFDAPGFYYKLGFRAAESCVIIAKKKPVQDQGKWPPQVVNEFIKQELKKASAEGRLSRTRDTLYPVAMYLPKTQQKEWLKRIRKHPVLYT